MTETEEEPPKVRAERERFERGVAALVAERERCLTRVREIDEAFERALETMKS